MSRSDPGAANGTGLYPVDPRCECGCPAVLHAIGQRGGQRIRTGCPTSNCPCSRYRPEHCPRCGAPWNPIEAARLK